MDLQFLGKQIVVVVQVKAVSYKLEECQYKQQMNINYNNYCETIKKK